MINEESLKKSIAFNRHSKNTEGRHDSPFNNGAVWEHVNGIVVRLVQGLDEENFKSVLTRSLHATTGLNPDDPSPDQNWEEMLKGGLQAALESQVVIFEIAGVSRACTHQLVRTRKAGFHQQSQRATYMGEEPDVRMPDSVAQNGPASLAFVQAVAASRKAYEIACAEDIAYQDARYILPEGSVTYIMCEYPLREFLNTYAYRACSMFLWETVYCFRKMGELLVGAHPWLRPYVKISCQTGPVCPDCFGTGQDEMEAAGHRGMITCPTCGGGGRLGAHCTFQGWEKVDDQCPFPWAKEELRIYKPDRSLSI